MYEFQSYYLCITRFSRVYIGYTMRCCDHDAVIQIHAPGRVASAAYTRQWKHYRLRTYYSIFCTPVWLVPCAWHLLLLI